MLREIASVPQNQQDRIAGIVEGAKKTLTQICTSSDDPVQVYLEFKDSGNCHIYLEYGKWVGPLQAEFETDK